MNKCAGCVKLHHDKVERRVVPEMVVSRQMPQKSHILDNPCGYQIFKKYPKPESYLF
jgi:hypothetical protein